MEWKKNLRMNHAVFVSVVDDCQPFLQHGRSPRGLDVLTVEKQLAMTQYFWRIKALFRWRQMHLQLRVAVSVVVKKVCNIITDLLGSRYRNEGTDLWHEKWTWFSTGLWMCRWYTYPHAQPSENLHDYLSYELKYTLNVQGIHDWKGLFLDVIMKWPGSGRVFGN